VAVPHQAAKWLTPAKLFGKIFGMWPICHSLSNDFYEVSEWEKKSNQKILLLAFELLKNHVQFFLHLGLNKAKPACIKNCRVGWGKMVRFSDILINNLSLYGFKLDFFSDSGH
jgi:hypothetical protein